MYGDKSKFPNKYALTAVCYELTGGGCNCSSVGEMVVLRVFIIRMTSKS